MEDKNYSKLEKEIDELGKIVSKQKEMIDREEKAKAREKFIKKISTFIMLFLLIASLAYTYNFYNKNKESITGIVDQIIQLRTETEETIESVQEAIDAIQKLTSIFNNVEQ